MDNPLRTIRVEFDVNLNCEQCATKVRDVLVKENVKLVACDVEKQSVVVETALPVQEIKEVIESTGKKAVLKGFGSMNSDSAVAEVKCPLSGIMGVIRFYQTANDMCVIDGTIDGLTPGEHGLHIHEYGDLSQGCESIGPHFNPNGSEHGDLKDENRHYGDLGNLLANESGRTSFRIFDKVVKVQDIIGRSIAISENRDDLGLTANSLSKMDGNSGKGIACAIIARSAGLFNNPKRLCQCDGISIWDENKTQSSL